MMGWRGGGRDFELAKPISARLLMPDPRTVRVVGGGEARLCGEGAMHWVTAEKTEMDRTERERWESCQS